MFEALLVGLALLGIGVISESRNQTLHDGGSASVASYVDSVMSDTNLSKSDWGNYVKYAPHNSAVDHSTVDTVKLVSQDCGAGSVFDPVGCHYKIGGR